MRICLKELTGLKGQPNSVPQIVLVAIQIKSNKTDEQLILYNRTGAPSPAWIDPGSVAKLSGRVYHGYHNRKRIAHICLRKGSVVESRAKI